MSKTTGVWFPIGNGPVLQAAAPLLSGLEQDRREGVFPGGYRIGAQRGPNKAADLERELEILFGDENEAFQARVKFRGPGQ